MTREQAVKLCVLLTGLMMRASNHASVANRLVEIFPQFKWRYIFDRSGQFTHWALTVDPMDDREHFVRKDGTCIHCGKTLAELHSDGFVNLKERSDERD